MLQLLNEDCTLASALELTAVFSCHAAGEVTRAACRQHPWQATLTALVLSLLIGILPPPVSALPLHL